MISQIVPSGASFDICKNALTDAQLPPGLAMGSDGTVAVLLPAERLSANNFSTRLLVRKPSGIIRVYSLPSPELLAKQFRMHTSLPNPKFQQVYFDKVNVGSDGSVFAVIKSHFSGGYSGTESTVFRRDRSDWVAVPERLELAPVTNDWQVSTDLGGVYNASRFAVVGIYGSQLRPSLDGLNDPHYLRYQLQLSSGFGNVLLGFGSSFNVGKRVTVGYRANQNPFGPTCRTPRPTEAIAWTGARAVSLGPGIAYGVNDRDSVVGDDEHEYGAIGYPMIWVNGRGRRVSSQPGVAFAISNSGYIVGKLMDHGFMEFSLAGRNVMISLNKINSSIRIVGAVGIEKDSRMILCVAEDSRKVRSAVLLKVRQ